MWSTVLLLLLISRHRHPHERELPFLIVFPHNDLLAAAITLAQPHSLAILRDSSSFQNDESPESLLDHVYSIFQNRRTSNYITDLGITLALTSPPSPDHIFTRLRASAASPFGYSPPGWSLNRLLFGAWLLIVQPPPFSHRRALAFHPYAVVGGALRISQQFSRYCPRLLGRGGLFY